MADVGLFLNGGTSPSDVPNSNLRALRTADKLSAHQVCLAQDRIVGSGRRLVASASMGVGDGEFFTQDDAGGDGQHPDKDTARTVLRARAPITPGSTLLVTYLAVPSGDREHDPGMSGTTSSAGPGGSVQLTTTWTNPDSDTSTPVVSESIIASAETNNAQPSADGGCFTDMIRGEFEAFPDGMFESDAGIKKWSQPGTMLDILIQHIGGARIIACSVWELPRAVAGDWADDAPACHLYSDGQGEPLGEYPAKYPVDFASSFVNGDDRFGSERVTQTAHRIGEIIGPTLFTHTVYNEHSDQPVDVLSTNAKTGDDEFLPVNITDSTNFTLLWDTSITAWDATTPALSIASGGHGRRYADSGYTITQFKTGTIRCRIGVWAKIDSSGTGYVRFQTSRWSYVDVPITSTTYAWHEVEAHLEVGRGPADDAPLRIFGQAAAFGNDLDYRYSYGVFLPDTTAST